MQACQRTFVPEMTIDQALLARQHAAYCQALRDCDCEVRVLDHCTDEPDCVFVEDTAVVLDELAILCPMGTAARRREPEGMASVLAEYRDVRRIELPATLEGGDVLRIGRTLLVGRSPRTNAAGIEALHRLVVPHGYTVRAVTTKGCLHLKTACTALPDGRLLVNAAWIDMADVADFDLASVPAAEPFAANTLPIGNTIVMPAEHPRTADLLSRRGWRPVCIELSELLKTEGSVTCLSLLLASESRP
jgi:dimethylargininase